MFLSKLQFSRRLLSWYDKVRRDLPWRVPLGTLPNPYHILISETMLQQTQVRTVLPYFHKFIESWPTLSDLAAADEQAVLKAWQGLGYYSRVRNLLKTVRQIAAEHQAQVPSDVATLLGLPGIGRYTAGAVASIAYDTSAPIVDGNVARVICRLDKITDDPRDRKTLQLLWMRAEQILPSKRVGDFNSALMELGATVCTPRNPQCLICPVSTHCEAFKAGLQNRIPLPKKAKTSPLRLRRVFCIRRRSGKDSRWLIEQRPAAGRWAGMWQFLTIEADERPVTAALVRATFGVKSAPPIHLGQIEHALTHRQYRFDVYRCEAKAENDAISGGSTPHARIWVSFDELARYPLPRPHARILERLLDIEKQ